MATNHPLRKGNPIAWIYDGTKILFVDANEKSNIRKRGGVSIPVSKRGGTPGAGLQEALDAVPEEVREQVEETVEAIGTQAVSEVENMSTGGVGVASSEDEYACNTNITRMIRAEGKHEESFWWNVTQPELDAWKKQMDAEAKKLAKQELDDKLAELIKYQCVSPCQPFLIRPGDVQEEWDRPTASTGTSPAHNLRSYTLTTGAITVCTLSSTVRYGCTDAEGQQPSQ